MEENEVEEKGSRGEKVDVTVVGRCRGLVCLRQIEHVCYIPKQTLIVLPSFLCFLGGLLEPRHYEMAQWRSVLFGLLVFLSVPVLGV